MSDRVLPPLASRRSVAVGLLFILLPLSWAARVSAQPVATDGAAGSIRYVRIAEPGDITVRVTVWGNVATGIYEVTKGMHLSTLFTLAGGSAHHSLDPRNRGATVVRIMRPDAGGDHRVVYETRSTAEGYLFEDDPVLAGGDVVLVQETASRRRFGWRDVLGIVTAAYSVVYLTERLVQLIR